MELSWFLSIHSTLIRRSSSDIWSWNHFWCILNFPFDFIAMFRCNLQSVLVRDEQGEKLKELFDILRLRSRCSVFGWNRSKTYSFRPCLHTDTLPIRSFSNTPTNTHTFDYSAYWIRFIFECGHQLRRHSIRRYFFNGDICLEMALWAPYLPGAVWTFRLIHSVFAWKRSSVNKHFFRLQIRRQTYTQQYQRGL